MPSYDQLQWILTSPLLKLGWIFICYKMLLPYHNMIFTMIALIDENADMDDVDHYTQEESDNEEQHDDKELVLKIIQKILKT